MYIIRASFIPKIHTYIFCKISLLNQDKNYKFFNPCLKILVITLFQMKRYGFFQPLQVLVIGLQSNWSHAFVFCFFVFAKKIDSSRQICFFKSGIYQFLLLNCKDTEMPTNQLSNSRRGRQTQICTHTQYTSIQFLPINSTHKESNGPRSYQNTHTQGIAWLG